MAWSATLNCCKQNNYKFTLRNIIGHPSFWFNFCFGGKWLMVVSQFALLVRIWTAIKTSNVQLDEKRLEFINWTSCSPRPLSCLVSFNTLICSTFLEQRLNFTAEIPANFIGRQAASSPVRFRNRAPIVSFLWLPVSFVGSCTWSEKIPSRGKRK